MMLYPDTSQSVFASAENLVQLRRGARELRLFPRHTPRSALTGNHQSRLRGRGMDFDEVRPYQPGDDIRTIDWRVTARTGSTHTKLFREERERPVLVVADLRQHMFFGSRKLKSVTTCEIGATLAWAGLHANDRVGGLVFGPGQHRDIRARRSHHSVLQLIHSLCAASRALQQRQPDDYTLAAILEHTRRVAHPGFTVVVISDFHDLNEATESHLFQLARHCDVNLSHLSDSHEKELPPPGRYPVTDGRQRFVLDTRNTALRTSFAEAFRARALNLQQIAQRLRLGLIAFPDNSAVLDVLQLAYGKNRQRRLS